MIGDDDLDLEFFENDFGVEAVFDGSVTLTGVFNQPSEGVRGLGNMQVEAVKPSITIRTSALADAANPIVPKMSCVIGENTYQVERIANAGNGYTDVWLKTSNG